MTTEWKLAKIQEVANLLTNKPLQEANIDVHAVNVEVDQAIDVGVDAVKLSVGAGASVGVRSFNAKGGDENKDDDGVLGKPNPDDPSLLTPPLVPGKRAWLKLSMAAQAKAGAGVKIPYLGIDGSGEVSVRVADYHVHELTEGGRDAFLKDVQALRLPMVPAHLAKLRDEEAFCFGFRGTLGATVTIRWSDVFTAGMGSVAAALSAGESLGVDIEAAASVSAEVKLTDDFIIVFSRAKKDEILAGVRKAPAVHASGGAKIELSLKLDEEDTKKVLDAALSALLKHKRVAELEALLDRLETSGTGAIGETEKAALELVLKRIGITLPLSDVKGVRSAWEVIKKETRKKLEETAASKIGGGFEYEYSRISENMALVELKLSDARAVELHNRLLLGDLAGVLGKLQEGELTRCFFRDTVKETHAWGFTLGFGKWSVYGRDKAELTFVRQYRTPPQPNRPEKVAVRGVRSYTRSHLPPIVWAGDFSAQMKDFEVAPRTTHFQYGLHANMVYSGKLSGADIAEAMRRATAWRVPPPSEAEQASLINQILGAAGGEPFEVRLEMTVKPALLRKLLPLFTKDLTDEMARALARALPQAGARPNVETCERWYAPLWKTFLKDKGEDWDATHAANNTQHHLKKQGAEQGLVHWEASGTNAGTARTETFAGLLEGGSLWNAWSSFAEGMALLHRLVTEGRAPEELRSVFSGLRGVWSQSFSITAFGALMVELCRRLGIEEELAKSLTVTYTDKSKPTRIIGTPRPGALAG